MLASTEALPDSVAERRAAGLHAVVDGLSAQLVTHSGDVSPDDARAVLRQVVSDLSVELSA